MEQKDLNRIDAATERVMPLLLLSFQITEGSQVVPIKENIPDNVKRILGLSFFIDPPAPQFSTAFHAGMLKIKIDGEQMFENTIPVTGTTFNFSSSKSNVGYDTDVDTDNSFIKGNYIDYNNQHWKNGVPMNAIFPYTVEVYAKVVVDRLHQLDIEELHNYTMPPLVSEEESFSLMNNEWDEELAKKQVDEETHAMMEDKDVY